jgi:TatD DNase family protein
MASRRLGVRCDQRFQFIQDLPTERGAKERKSELALCDRLLPEARYIGEVALDGSPEYRAFWQDQVEVFDHILASCAKAGGRILTLHSRAAATDVLDALKRRPGYDVAVLHCFSGTQRELSRAVGMGCWFSVGGSRAAE